MDHSPTENRSSPANAGTGRSRRVAVYGSFAGGIFGSALWMIIMGAIARDWAVVLAVGVVALAMFLSATQVCLQRPEPAYSSVAAWVSAGLGGLSLIVVNSRWTVWLEHYRRSPLYSRSSEMPLPLVNVAILAIFGLLVVVFTLRSRTERQRTHS
ncbi:MAG: hypothetical protein ACE5O2_11865 [Armatimonadota bacterium]